MKGDKMAKGTNRPGKKEATAKEAAKPKKEEAKSKEKKEKVLSQFGHKPNTMSGYIDEQISIGKTAVEIVKGWNKAHPEKVMTSGRLKGHVKHLILDHGFGEEQVRKMFKDEKKEKAEPKKEDKPKK